MIKTQGLSRAIFVAIVVVMVASCSGSDSTSSTTEDLSGRPGNSVVAPSSDPVGTEPSVTEPSLSVAESPTSTSTAATDNPTTTSAPPATPPTTVDDGTPQGAVTAAVAFFEQQWKTCLASLPDCDVVAATERRGGDVNVETNITAELFNNNDYRASRIDELSYRVDEVAISEDGVTALVTVCVTDPVGISEADGTPVNAAFLSSIEEYGLEIRAGDTDWTWITRTTVGEFVEGEENNICA